MDLPHQRSVGKKLQLRDMRAFALVLLLSYAFSAAGAQGYSPTPSSTTCTTRVGFTGRSCKRAEEQHAREPHDKPVPSFAESWVSRARGGGARVPAGGGDDKESAAKGGGGGGKAPDEVELALVGNFPNR